MLEDIYLENMGTPVVFLWIERIREFLQDRAEDLKSQSEAEAARAAEELRQSLQFSTINDDQPAECPEIVTGNCIEDRKSVFQGENLEFSIASLGYCYPPYPVWHGNCCPRGQQSSPRAFGPRAGLLHPRAAMECQTGNGG